MSTQTVVDVVISGSTTTVVDKRIDGVTTVAGAPPVTNVSGQIPDLGVDTDILAAEGDILSLTNDVANLRANLIVTGTTLTDEIGVLSGHIISTGNNLEFQISTLSGNLIATGNNLDSLRDILSGNLISTGQNLLNQIVSNDSDISELKSSTGLLSSATGSLQDTKLDKAGGFITGSIIPNESGTIALGTESLPFLSGHFVDLAVSENSLFIGEVPIRASNGGIDFSSATGTTEFRDVSIRNLTVTGTEVIVDVEHLAVKDNTIIINSGEEGAGITKGSGGLVIDRGSLPDADFIFDETSDAFKLNFPLSIEGSLAVKRSETGSFADNSDVSTVANNLNTTGQTLQTQITSNDSDISSLTNNLVTTGQTLQTQITNNDSDISNLTSDLITTGQTLTSEISTVSGLITDNDGDISDLKTATGELKTQVNTTDINLINTGQYLTDEIAIVSGIAGGDTLNELSGKVDDISGNLITTGQTLTTDINTVSGLIVDNDGDITDLKTATGVLKTSTDSNASNLITTGQTLTSEIAIVSGIAENASDEALSGRVDALSGNLITTGQTLQTQITSNDSDISTLTSNLGVTGQTLQTQITSNDSDISTLTSNLITTGQSLTTDIATVSGIAEAHTDVTELSGKVNTISGNLITTGQTLQTQITSNDSDITSLTSNLVTTGQTLTTDITTVSGLIVDNDGDITALKTATGVLKTSTDSNASNLITTGQTLQTQITSNDGDISTLTTNLGTTGQTLQTQITSNDSDINTLTSNLITTGQTLTTDISTVSGLITDNDDDITALKSATGVLKTSTDTNTTNLITTGQTLQTQITSNDGDITALTSNLVTTGQTLQTQITSNDSDISTLTTNLGTTGQTLQTQITSNDSDITSLTSNLITTGQTLTTDINTVSGLITDNDADITALKTATGVLKTSSDNNTANLITTGQTLQTQITSNDGDIATLTSNLISTGVIVDDISGNLITTGQTLQTQITSNDSDITNLTSNLITTGQTLTNDVNTVSGLITDNDADITALKNATGVLKTSTDSNTANLIATGSVIDDVSGNLITTGQTLQTQITSNDGDITTLTSNLVTTGQTLTTNIDTVAANLGTSGQTLQTQITSNDSDISTLTSNLGTTGQTLQTQITSNDSDISSLTTNLGTTGQTLQTQITSNDSDISTLDSTTVKLTTNQSIAGNKIFTNDVTINNLTVTGTEVVVDVENLAVKDNIIEINSGESGAGISRISGGITIDRGTATNANILYNDANDRFELNFPLAVEDEVVASASNLITTGQTLTTNINTVSTNLGTSGQTLQTQITSNDSDISTLTTNLGTTGQTLQTQITSNDSDISTLTTNLGTTGQTLQTQITSNDSDISTLTSNLVTTGQTLQTQITSNDSDISTLTSNLVTTGQTLTANVNTVSTNLVSTGSVVDDISGNLITTGQTLQTQITSNDSDITTLTSNLVTTGQTLTTNINTVSTNLISTGKVVDDISGNLITTGQTLQTQITSNDTDITNLSSNLITTGQTLTTNINTVATNLVTTGQTLTSEIATVSGLIPATVIDGSGTANKVPLWSDANTIGDSIISQSNYGIGIGTTSPSRDLHVYDSSAYIRIEATGGYSYLEMVSTYSTYGSYIRFLGSSNTIRGTIYADSYSNLRLYGGSNSSTPLFLKSDGNVGVGQLGASYLLDIQKTSGTNLDVFAVRGATSAFLVQCSDLSAANPVWNLRTFSGEDLTLKPGNSEAVRIKADGDVGIGTNVPGAKIDVNGSAIFRGAAGWAGSDNQACAIYLNTAGRGVMGNFANYARNLVKANSQYVEVGQNSTLVYGVKFIVGSNAANGFMFQSNIGGTMTTLMNIRGNTGRVGINTTSPSELLDIRSDDGTDHTDSTPDTLLRLRKTFSGGGGTDKDSAVNFDVSRYITGGNNRPRTRLDFVLSGDEGDTYDSSEPNVNVLSIKSDSRVGIATTSPSTTLHVNKTGVGDNVIAEVLRLSTLNSASPTWSTTDGLCIGAEMKKADGTTITKQPIRFRYDGGDMATTFEEGKVGIGTASPSTKLHVNGALTVGGNSTLSGNLDLTGALVVNGASTLGDTNDTTSINSTLVVNGSAYGPSLGALVVGNGLNVSSGSVGIGTTNPSETLEINHSNHEPVLIKSAGNYNSMITMDSNRSSANSYVGGLAGKWNGTQVASIYLRTGSDTTNKDDGYITLLTAPAGTVVERMRIQPDGNVGIGITTPGQKLHVNGSAEIDGSIYINDTNTRIFEGSGNSVRLETNYGYIDVGSQNSSWAHISTDRSRFYFNKEIVVETGIIRSYDEDLQFDASYNGAVAKNIRFRTGNVEKMRMDTNGNVGIGITSPGSILQIKGDGTLFGSTITVKDSTGTTDRFYGGLDANEHAYISLVGNDNTNRVYLTGSSSTSSYIVNNVGIGTNSPVARLHVHETTAGRIQLTNGTSNATASDGLAIAAELSTRAYFWLYENAYMQFATNNVERMRITAGGNVGIGTNAPAAKLDIWGANGARPTDPFGGQNQLFISQGGTYNAGITISADNNAGTQICTFIQSNTSASAALIGTQSNHGARIRTNNTDRITIASGGAITFNSAFTFPTTDGSANQMLKTDGSGNLSWTSAGSGTVTGSGTDNYIPRWNGTTALEDSAIYDNGSNRISLGTINTSPWQALHVQSTGSQFSDGASGNNNYNVAIVDQNAYTSNYAGGILFGGKYNNAGSITTLGIVSASKVNGDGNYGGKVHIGGRENGTSNVPKVLTVTHASVGIGTNAPTEPLHVESAAADILINSTTANQATRIRLKTTSHEYRIGTFGSSDNFWIYDADNAAYRMVISPAGAVGINTTSPNTSSKLHVYGWTIIQSATNLASLRLQSTTGSWDIDNNNGTFGLQWAGGDKFNITSAGSVGIGTNAPSAKLYVVGPTLGSTLNVESKLLHIKSSLDGNTGHLEIKDVRTSAGTTWTTSGRRIQMKVDSTYMAYIQFNGTGNNYGMSFGTGANMSQPGNVTEAMRIVSSGSVGIGTTNPGALLHADGNVIIGDTDRETTTLTIKAQNTAGAPAATTQIRMKGYEGRGIGTFYEDSSYSGQEWFCGMNYSAAFGTWNVGYDASGGQAEYNANTLFRVRYTGRVEMLNYGSGTFTGTPAYKLAVDSSGNIIETAVGAGQVDGSGTTNYVAKWTDGDTIGNSSIFDNGSVGIGTTAPLGKLHVYGGQVRILDVTSEPSYGARLVVGRDTAQDIEFHVDDLNCKIVADQDGDSDGNHSFILNREFGGSGANDFRIQKGGSSQLLINTDGNVGIGTLTPGSILQIEGDGTLFGSTITIRESTGTTDRFYGGLDANEHGYISLLGNDNTNRVYLTGSSSTSSYILNSVGIGTASPFTNLTVYGATDSRIALVNSNTGTSASDGFVLIAEADSDVHFLNREDSDMFFSTNGTKKMTILSGGNVGIGTASPSAKLHVVASTDDGIRINSNNAIIGQKTTHATHGTQLLFWNGTDAYLGRSISGLGNGTVTSWNIRTGGADTVIINSTGLGIGGISPSAKLHIRSTGLSDNSRNSLLLLDGQFTASGVDSADEVGIAFRVENSGGGSQQTTCITSSYQPSYNSLNLQPAGGNVGIGTVSPARTLDLTTTGQITFGNNVVHNGSQGIYWHASNTYGIYRTGEGWNSPNYAQLQIRFETGIILHPGSGAHGRSHVGVVGGVSIGDSYFSTKEDNGLIVQGSVGIGTNDPSYLLDLESTATGLTHNLKLNKSSNTGDYAEIAFQLWSGAGTGLNTFGGSGTSRPSVVLRAVNENTNSAAGAFVVGTFTGGSTNSTLTEKFRITSAGSVGIGTTAPSSILQIKGDGTLLGSTITVKDSTGATDRFYGGLDANEHGYISLVGNDNTNRVYLNGGSSIDNYILNDVGIGTTSPSAKLHVKSASTDSWAVLATASDGSNLGGIYEAGDGAGVLVAKDAGGTNKVYLDGQGSSYINGGNVGIGVTSPSYKLEVNGSFAATTKSFVIDHPTKPNKKLRYASLEGPENGVYVRGKGESNIIELPEYWAELVYEESITVNLVPIGSDSNNNIRAYSVQAIKDNKVYIYTDSHDNVYKYFFTIYGERKDVEKLKVEID